MEKNKTTQTKEKEKSNGWAITSILQGMERMANVDEKVTTKEAKKHYSHFSELPTFYRGGKENK